MDLDDSHMILTRTDPIAEHWTIEAPTATAIDVNRRLALLEVADIEAHLVPYLAAAAAELASIAAVPWRFAGDDAPVALLRMIAKVTIRHPDVGGPHTARLLEQLS